ncbi:MAG: septum formation initiator family protein [Spirochaetaceae bacterium]
MKLLVSTAVAILTHLMLSLVWGEYGLIAYRELDTYRDRLDENLERLEERTLELEREAQTLQTDAERIRVEARRLGYYAENETPVRLEEYRPASTRSSPGSVIRRRSPPADNAPILRAIAASAGLFTLFLMLVVDQRRT